MLDSLREKLPPNASRALLYSAGTLPRTPGIFHSLNQRLDSSFPKSVATFHDLFVISGDYSTPAFRQRFTDQAKRAAERADLVIAVSQFTAGQLQSLLGVDPQRIRVVHHGVDASANPPIPDAARQNVVLHVGAIQKRKNLSRLVEAFESMPAGWKLVLAGSQGFGAEEILARVEKSPRRNDIELPGYVDARTLDTLYNRARIFAFPSLDEGFGMPVLEAMSRGVAVLTSDGSALSEIADKAALLIDPTRTESIAAGLQLLGGNTGDRERFRSLGLEHVRKFSWSKAVNSTWAVYGELV